MHHEKWSWTALFDTRIYGRRVGDLRLFIFIGETGFDLISAFTCSVWVKTLTDPSSTSTIRLPVLLAYQRSHQWGTSECETLSRPAVVPSCFTNCGTWLFQFTYFHIFGLEILEIVLQRLRIYLPAVYHPFFLRVWLCQLQNGKRWCYCWNY